LWPNRPLRTVTELSGDLDRIAAEHEPRGVEQGFVLGGADLRLDDLNGQVFLLPTD